MLLMLQARVQSDRGIYKLFVGYSSVRSNGPCARKCGRTGMSCTSTIIQPGPEFVPLLLRTLTGEDSRKSVFISIDIRQQRRSGGAREGVGICQPFPKSGSPTLRLDARCTLRHVLCSFSRLFCLQEEIQGKISSEEGGQMGMDNDLPSCG